MAQGNNKKLVYIGTSGWSYKWDNFYPRGLADNKRLTYFSQHFLTTEVNYSFYRLPSEKTFKRWRKETPANFIFSLKLSRYITHIKRLFEIKKPLKEFLFRARLLENKLGPILVQLPPNFKIDIQRIDSFLRAFKEVGKEAGLLSPKTVFEFRHSSWFLKGALREELIEILRNNKSAFAFAHSSKYPYPEDEPLTADFVYFRFHGPKELFSSEYGEKGLRLWAQKIRDFSKKKMIVYAYFNNDVLGYAVKDAIIIQNLIRKLD